MMNRQKAILSALLVLLVIVGGLKVWLSRTPQHSHLKGRAQEVFTSVSECAHNQKRVFLAFEEYQGKFDQLPSDIGALIKNTNTRTKIYYCPEAHEHETERYIYKLYPENYGNPSAVFIEESRDIHPSTIMLWIRGITPQVQTMGDGTIHLFEDGQVATINVRDQ